MHREITLSVDAGEGGLRSLRWLEVERSQPLCGSVDIPGSKNSVQALLAAACLADDTVVLDGVPDLLDMPVILDICASLGLKATVLAPHTLSLDPRSIRTGEVPPKKSSAYRAAYYFVGALLAKMGRVSVGYPGGDNFGERPMEQHFKGLKALGAKVTFHSDHYVVESNHLRGAEIYFDTVTMGGTINVMLAAVRAEGLTILRNAAQDPEVVDVANLLVAMGASVKGAGTSEIRIEGTDSLSGCRHTVIPDRLTAGTFLIGAAATKGKVTVRGVIPEHLSAVLAKLRDMGMQITVANEDVTAQYVGSLKAIRLGTLPYPGFPTDLQQPLTAALLAASGRSLVVDTVFRRFNHLPQLRRMGAQFRERQQAIMIPGGQSLQGTYVHATDVRAGASLVLAGLMASGTTRISGVEHILRGYENVVTNFSSLGASIRMLEEDAQSIKNASFP